MIGDNVTSRREVCGVIVQRERQAAVLNRLVELWAKAEQAARDDMTEQELLEFEHSILLQFKVKLTELMTDADDHLRAAGRLRDAYAITEGELVAFYLEDDE